MFEEIKSILVDELNINADAVTPEANLSTDLGINSIELASLLDILQEKFDVTVEDEDIPTLQTIGDLTKFVEEHK